MPGQHLLAVFLVFILPVWDHFETRRLKTSKDPRVKVQSYQMTIAWMWLASAAAAAMAGIRTVMSFQGARPAWLPESEGFGTGVVIGALAVGLALPIILAAKNAAVRQCLRGSFDKLSFFLPSTTQERLWFAVVCISAGICEELLFRGFLIYYLASQPWIPNLTAALVVSCVIFGIGHLYQGLAGVLQTAFMAAVFGAIFVWTGNLIAPMILHALIDLRILVLYRPKTC